MLHAVTFRLVLVVAPLLIAGACVHVESGTDPLALGYGPGAHATLSSGYDPDPVPRPAPAPWTPPSRTLASDYAAAVSPVAQPVPYNDDLLQVCAHIGGLLPPTPDAAAGARRTEACLQHYRVERVFRPIVDWKTLATCLGAAKDDAAIAACERATPRVFGPIAEYPRESEVCMHIFAITILEQLGAEPMLDAERLTEFEELLQECVNSLVTDERDDRNPSEYVEMLQCIEMSRTTAAAEACE